MKRSLSVWQIVGFIFTGILGVLLHFLFDLTNQSVLVAPFSAVNESIFEHIKLLFFPMLVFALVENRYIGKEYKGFWCVKLIGVVLGIVLIPVLYYTINGIFGNTPDWVNIAIFFLTTAIVYWVETRLLKGKNINCKSNLALLMLFLIALVLAVWTCIPPHIPFFEDPLTQTYGYFKSVDNYK